VITQRDEERILGDYRSLLRGEEERLEAVKHEIDRLESIVGGIEGRLQGRQADADAPQESPTAPEPAAPSPLSIRNGRPTFASSVRHVMGDGMERDASALLPELHKLGVLPADGDRTKQMQKVANTFVELAKQGDLVRCGRGTYKLASTEAPTEPTVLERPAGEQPGLAGSLAVGAAAVGIGALAAHALTAGGGGG
jgi:hypothetical protein